MSSSSNFKTSTTSVVLGSLLISVLIAVLVFAILLFLKKPETCDASIITVTPGTQRPPISLLAAVSTSPPPCNTDLCKYGGDVNASCSSDGCVCSPGFGKTYGICGPTMETFISNMINIFFDGGALPPYLTDYGYPAMVPPIWATLANVAHMDPLGSSAAPLYSTQAGSGCSFHGIGKLGYNSGQSAFFVLNSITGLSSFRVLKSATNVYFDTAANSVIVAGVMTTALGASVSVGVTLGTYIPEVPCINLNLNPTVAPTPSTSTFRLAIPITIGAEGVALQWPASTFTMTTISPGEGLLGGLVDQIKSGVENLIAGVTLGIGITFETIWGDTLGPIFDTYISQLATILLKFIEPIMPSHGFSSLPSTNVYFNPMDALLNTPMCIAQCAGKCNAADDGCGGTRCASPPDVPSERAQSKLVCNLTTNTWCATNCNVDCGLPDDGCGGSSCVLGTNPKIQEGEDILVCDFTTHKWCETDCVANQKCGNADDGCGGTLCAPPDEGAVCYQNRYCTPQCKGKGPSADDSCGGHRCVCQLWELPIDKESVCTLGPSPYMATQSFHSSFFLQSTLESGMGLTMNGDGDGFRFVMLSDMAPPAPPGTRDNKLPDYWSFECTEPSKFRVSAVYLTTNVILQGTYWMSLDATTQALVVAVTNPASAATFTVTQETSGALVLSTQTSTGATVYLTGGDNVTVVPLDIAQFRYFRVVGGCSSSADCAWHTGTSCQNYKCTP